MAGGILQKKSEAFLVGRGVLGDEHIVLGCYAEVMHDHQ